MSLKNLIRLDFYTLKPLFKIMCIFLIVPIILGIVSNLETSIMVTLTFLCFLLNTVFSIGEKSNFNKLYGTLPIQRSVVILSRYLFSIIVLSITAIISLLMYISLSFILHGTINWTNGICFLVLSFNIAIFFISIQYPMFFKFEYSKASIMSILPYVVCFAIGAPLLTNLMKNENFYKLAMDVITYSQSNVIIVVLIGLLISAMMIGSSYAVSLATHKKEF